MNQLIYTNNECKVRLTENIVMTGAITVNNGNRLTIDLNGHTLTALENSRAFFIQNGALTIEDSIGGGIIQGSGTVNGYGGAILMNGSDSNNALTLTGSTISGFTATNGAGVSMGNGTFHMTGGAIRNCSATDGGGVYVDGGSFKMTNGTISDCKATNAGGGVYVSSGTFEMSGGSIENCTAYEGAGVKVLVSSGKASFSMSDGTIEGSSRDGVSIAAIDSGTSEFSMSGGTIKDNSRYGVWVDNGSAVMSGGSVKGSGSYDIYIGSSAALTVDNTQVGGTVLNMGKITGQGSAEFTGTVENSGYAVAKITGCKIHRIEHRSPYNGTIENSTWDEYVYLLGRSWPKTKIPSAAGESISWIDDPNERKQVFAQILSGGDRRRVLHLIRMLYVRRRELQKNGKHLRIADEQTLRDAEKLLNDEFAHVLHIPQQDVPDYIRSRMEREA